MAAVDNTHEHSHHAIMSTYYRQQLLRMCRQRLSILRLNILTEHHHGHKNGHAHMIDDCRKGSGYHLRSPCRCCCLQSYTWYRCFWGCYSLRFPGDNISFLSYPRLFSLRRLALRGIVAEFKAAQPGT